MMSVLFGIKIASMHGVVAKKNVRRQMQMDGWTDGRPFSFIYDTCYCSRNAFLSFMTDLLFLLTLADVHAYYA